MSVVRQINLVLIPDNVYCKWQAPLLFTLYCLQKFFKCHVLVIK